MSVLRHIEVAIDDGDQHRAGLVAGAHVIDIGAGGDQRTHRIDVALARGEMERRQASLRPDQLVEDKRPIHAGNLLALWPRLRRPAGTPGATAL